MSDIPTNQLPALIDEEVNIDAHPVINKKGINIGANTVTQCTAHLPEDQRNLVRWIHNFARERGLTWEEAEVQSKISKTTLYRIWSDKYLDPQGHRVPLDAICERIARMKRIAELRADLPREFFIETSTYRRIAWLCSKAFKRQKIGFIYGESQVGKTRCLLEYARVNNHGQTAYAEMPPASGVQLMTKSIAKALHVSHNTSFDKLLEDVCDALDDSKLLIIDEIHRVFTTYQKNSVMRCLDVLRYIHDNTHCGLVLCGTNVFRDNLKQGEFFQYLKQLQRRGLYELQLLDIPPVKDLDLVAKHFGLRLDRADAKALEIVNFIAKKDGLGKFIIRLTDAAELATNQGSQLSWSHFVDAHEIIEKAALDGSTLKANNPNQ